MKKPIYNKEEISNFYDIDLEIARLRLKRAFSKSKPCKVIEKIVKLLSSFLKYFNLHN